jgi:hypothetical protein
MEFCEPVIRTLAPQPSDGADFDRGITQTRKTGIWQNEPNAGNHRNVVAQEQNAVVMP